MNVDDDRYEVHEDPYCYPNSLVLKNKANLRDAGLLDEFEIEMSLLRASEELPEGDFDFVHYKSVHHHLFQDVYDWAGKCREVRISKGGNAFCYPEFIEGQAAALFGTLTSAAFVGQGSKEEFIGAAAEFLAELNAIHCFRDGNGRAQLAFMHLVGLRAGYPFEFERVHRDTFLPAMIASFHGDLDPLKRELAELCQDDF